MAVKKASSTTKAAAEKKTAAKPAAEVKEAAKPAAKAEKAPAKAIETKKDTTKKLETKAAVLVNTPEKKAEEKAVKKAPVKKTTAKKPAVKKTVKKAEVKTEMFLQFAGKEFTEKELFQKVKDVWTKELKNKVGDMKDVKIYLKPEESAAYYVVNGDTTGRIQL